MKFDLDAMRAAPGRFFHVSGEEILSELDWRGETVHLEGPVRTEARAMYQNGQVMLNIRVYTRARRPCSRCLRDVLENVHYAGDMDVFPADLEGKYLELRPFIEAGVRLGLSLKPLCKQDCRGICPECGADLNVQPHKATCPTQHKGDPRLKKLKVLLEGLAS